MANGLFNISRGSVNEIVKQIVANNPANSALVIVLLQAAEADAVLEDYDDLATLLAAAGNTEASFDNYARVTYTDVELSAPTVDDTGNTLSSDMPDPVWTSAGGTTNNTLAKLLICLDEDTTAGNDSNIRPLLHYDFVETTNGNNLTGIVNASGFYQA